MTNENFIGEFERPIKTVEVGPNTYFVVVLTQAQVDRIADAVVQRLLSTGLDVVLADRIRDRMRDREDAEVQRELAAEHRRYASGFEHE